MRTLPNDPLHDGREPRADGDNQAAPFGELRPELLRKLGGFRGDNNRVVGSLGLIPLPAVAMDYLDPIVSRATEIPPRLFGEMSSHLHSDNRAGIPDGLGDARRSVAAAGAYLQNTLSRAHLGELEHNRHGVGLTNRLSLTNGQRSVDVRPLSQLFRHKELSRNSFYGAEYRRGSDSLSFEGMFK